MTTVIHAYTEVQIGNEWIATERHTYKEEKPNALGYKPAFMQEVYIPRSYAFYGLLVEGARANYPWSFPEKGMPLDCSEEVRTICDALGFTGFAHSYLNLKELVEKYLELMVSGPDAKEHMADLRNLIHHLMTIAKGYELKHHTQIRLVMWFDEVKEPEEV